MADVKAIDDGLYYPSFPRDWKRSQLYELANWINGIAFKDINFDEDGLPVIKISEIKNGLTDQTRYTNQCFDKSVLIKTGDLLFSWSGQPETSIDASWWRGPEGWLNQHIFRVISNDMVDSVFFYYILKYAKPNFVGIAKNKQTTGLGHVTKKDLARMEVAYPPLPEQRRIAHILGTLDDKIENNRKTAKTLEAMAQAIFKSWFVDFDPVRAKMAGESRDSICKRLKLTPEILDLFPDRLVDSELGEIPEGWHNKAISEIVKRVSVGTKYDTKKVFEIGKVPVLDQGKSGIIGYHNGTPDIHASPTNPIIIFANHTCYMRLIPYDFSVIQNVLPFYGDGVDTIWAYFATRDKISFSEYKGHWPDFILEPVIVPSKALTTYFRTIISDLISAIFVADAMNEPISKTRDTLLPKLISGELRVSDPALLI